MAIQINQEQTAERMVERIKAVGQSLIDNAERIYNNYKYSCGPKIFIEIDPRSAQTIKVEKEFYPETFIEKSPLFKD